MSFVASPPAPASPEGSTISVGDFWPALDVNRFRDAMRLGGTSIPDPRVVEALAGAAIVAADNLADWVAAQIAAGYDTLAGVPSVDIAHGVGEGAVTETRLVILWRRAVHAFAAADLIETHRDVSATAAGTKEADRQALTPDDHRRNAVHAIRAMIGKPRTTVALI